MTAGTATDKPRSLIEQAQQLTLEQIWAALPQRVQNNPGCMARLEAAGPKLSAATYKDFFWEDDPDEPGRKRRSLPEDKLLTLMVGLYLHKGGDDPEGEAAFWQGVWAQ